MLCRYAKCANYFAVSYAWPPTLFENHSGFTRRAWPLSYLSEVSCLSSLLSSLLSVSSLALSLVSFLFSLLTSLSLYLSLPPYLYLTCISLSLLTPIFHSQSNLHVYIRLYLHSNVPISIYLPCFSASFFLWMYMGLYLHMCMWVC